MDTKKIKDARHRLTAEHEKLVELLHRKQVASEEIKMENTEDEGDLATMSHDKALLNSLHEGAFANLKSIREALKALDSGEYGECVNCRKDINEKRLQAVPWATLFLTTAGGSKSILRGF